VHPVQILCRLFIKHETKI